MSRLVLIGVVLVSGVPLFWRDAAAASVDCAKGQTISAAVGKLKPTSDYEEIKVSGSCSDNVYIGPGLSVALVGATGAALAPANTGLAAITVAGHLILANMSVTTGSFAAVFANQGAFATLLAVTISGPGTGLQVSDNSGALVQNSAIDVTGFAGINTYAGANVEIDGIAKIYGSSGTTLTGGTDGVYCAQGGITLTTSGGPITLSGSGSNGIETSGCNVKTNVVAGFPITISGNGSAKGGGAVSASRNASIDLNNVDLINNNGTYAVGLFEGAAAVLTGDTITGNSGQAIQADQNSIAHFQNYGGINTVSAPNGNTSVLFSCYQGGKIYVDQVAGFITPAPTGANQGCLTIGGP